MGTHRRERVLRICIILPWMLVLSFVIKPVLGQEITTSDGFTIPVTYYSSGEEQQAILDTIPSNTNIPLPDTVVLGTLPPREVQADRISAIQKNIVRIWVQYPKGDGGTYTDYGTGAYLGDKLVLTAQHVLRDGMRSGNITQILVIFPSDNTAGSTAYYSDAKILHTNAQWDQALLEVVGEPYEHGIPLATREPVQGGQATHRRLRRTRAGSTESDEPQNA